MEISFKNPDRTYTLKPKSHRCDHLSLELDMDLRIAVCSKCGCNVDVFDWLVGQAVSEGIAINRVKRLHEEITKLQKVKCELI